MFVLSIKSIGSSVLRNKLDLFHSFQKIEEANCETFSKFFLALPARARAI
jgi:hypothetical protein